MLSLPIICVVVPRFISFYNKSYDNILKNTVISKAQEIRASWDVKDDEDNPL